VRPREAGATNQTKQKASGANGTPPEAVSYEKNEPQGGNGGGEQWYDGQGWLRMKRVALAPILSLTHASKNNNNPVKAVKPET